MRLVMTLKVRDEADIIEDNLRFHRAMGVDFFVVTDNGSVDGTSEILDRYVSAGLAHVIQEPTSGLRSNEMDWTTRMARLAASEYGADWVFNNDADEFWWPITGDDQGRAGPDPGGVRRGGVPPRRVRGAPRRPRFLRRPPRRARSPFEPATEGRPPRRPRRGGAEQHARGGVRRGRGPLRGAAPSGASGAPRGSRRRRGRGRGRPSRCRGDAPRVGAHAPAPDLPLPAALLRAVREAHGDLPEARRLPRRGSLPPPADRVRAGAPGRDLQRAGLGRRGRRGRGPGGQARARRPPGEAASALPGSAFRRAVRGQWESSSIPTRSNASAPRWSWTACGSWPAPSGSTWSSWSARGSESTSCTRRTGSSVPSSAEPWAGGS